MQPLIEHRNRIIRVDQVKLVENALAETYLTADIAASNGTLTVKDIAGFSTGKYVWIDPLGANSEIIAVHASTAPSGSTITLAASTAFAHEANEKIVYIEFNQIEISHADTLTGTKSVLATQAMLARAPELPYLDTSETAGFYFARYKDSVGSTYSSYSDGITYGGWAENTVGYMIDAAMADLSVQFSEKLQMKDCIRWTNKGLREIKGKIRRWPEHYVYDYVADQAQRGDNIVTLPSDIYDTESNDSIEAIRVGDGGPLAYVDPSQFDVQLGDVKKTQVRTEASASDTTLDLDNSYDLEDSGTVNVYISGTKYSITYTGVTRDDVTGATAQLTGIPSSGDGSISVTIPVDTYVWQDEEEGTPLIYTVRNAQVEFWPLVDASHDNANVYFDYNTAVTTVDSESDTIDYLRYDMLQSYLTWRIWCKMENDGALDKSNGYYHDYKEALNDAIRTMRPHKTKTGPNINRMIRRGGIRTKPDPTLLPNDQQ